MSHGSHDNKGNGDKDGKSSHHGDGKYDRNDLHEPVDWMTYSHEALYKMVHTGVNLDGAQAAATNWKKIGEDIAGVRTSLLKAVEDSSVGWDSESARLARDGLTEVTNWVDDTANYATKVSAAITTETSNVEAARAAMPPPPKAPAAPVPADTALPRPVLQDRLQTVDQIDGFGAAGLREPRLIAQPQTEFAGFETIGTSPVDTLAANDASHRLAADVMAAFQRNSAAVDQTVPTQFTPPVNPINPTPVGGDLTGRTPTTTDSGAGGAAGAPVATGTQNQNRGTTNASSRFGGGGAGGRGGAGGGGGFGGGMARPFGTGSGNQGAAASGAGGAASAGGSAGVSEGSRGGGVGGAAAAASAAPGNTTKAFQNPLAMGGAPMAGAPMGGGGQNDSKEHKTASYLEEDDNVFGLDRKAAPPVIGQ
ncbi:PPE domain-containing protein [Lentzea flaviverrucosa]|uniref:PPE family protein n=1 Tax=Lentzea flaviverrucosa TaxID=200379 RepID=A0A1H9WZB7_9PSEU|nr:PPE domain-containing protein [Lentzea flaviverrucosa]RDI21045.1 PPE family protein [Lentzea flaviverrucosa]SES39184.1 PPE family protein [Lentzea flaviverrucosa]